MSFPFWVTDGARSNSKKKMREKNIYTYIHAYINGKKEFPFPIMQPFKVLPVQLANNSKEMARRDHKLLLPPESHSKSSPTHSSGHAHQWWPTAMLRLAHFQKEESRLDADRAAGRLQPAPRTRDAKATRTIPPSHCPVRSVRQKGDVAASLDAPCVSRNSNGTRSIEAAIQHKLVGVYYIKFQFTNSIDRLECNSCQHSISGRFSLIYLK